MQQAMSKVILCLGSNQDAPHHIDAAKALLRQTLTDVRFTSAVWTKPVGGKPSDGLYLNCLAEARTDLDYPTLHQKLKDMEHALGSSPTERRQGIVLIDIDILMLGHQHHHEDNWQHDYVKDLLTEL